MESTRGRLGVKPLGRLQLGAEDFSLARLGKDLARDPQAIGCAPALFQAFKSADESGVHRGSFPVRQRPHAISEVCQEFDTPGSRIC